jgi:MoxR-like ATPase
MEIVVWNVKSTTKARDGLYVYDTVQRLNDARFGDGDVRDIRRYIRLGPLGRAFAAERRTVLLIDEVDKADIEFPNDLLQELDEMRFHILETDETVAAVQRPAVVVTSNSEKELPDAFLRRCVFHYIDFPDPEQMRAIIAVHFPNLAGELLEDALAAFYQLREVPGLRKKPSTSELLDWIRVLLASGARPSGDGAEPGELPFLGTLIKMQEDADAVVRGGAKGLDGRVAGRKFFR